MIAAEHEGPLSDPEVKRAADQMAKAGREVVGQNLLALTENRAFMFWFSRWYVPMQKAMIPLDSGSKLVAFMAKRELLVQMAQEMEAASPGFDLRVLEVREEYDRMLQGAARE